MVRVTASGSIFLSRSYFTSRNCLREVVTTMRKKKPVVLVWEPDQNKGGAPVEVLKKELFTRRQMLEEIGNKYFGAPATPEECVEYVFETSQVPSNCKRPTCLRPKREVETLCL